MRKKRIVQDGLSSFSLESERMFVQMNGAYGIVMMSFFNFQVQDKYPQDDVSVLQSSYYREP